MDEVLPEDPDAEAMLMEIRKIQYDIDELKFHLPHPYEQIKDRNILKKIEKVYLIHYTTKNTIQFSDTFKPISIRRMRLDDGKPVFVWNGNYVRLHPSNAEEEQRTLDFKDLEKQIEKDGEPWTNHLFVFLHTDETWGGWCHERIIIFLVLITIIILLLQSFDSFKTSKELQIMEIIATGYFTFEYVCQWICVRNKIQYFTRVLSILDVVAILPKYVEFAAPNAPTGILSALKIFRLVRLSKMPVFQNPYADIVLQSIIDMLWGSGSIITLYILILVILGGVGLAEYASNDEVPDGAKGMWYTFASIFSGENQLENLNALTYIIVIFQITMGVLIISSIINTLGEYHHKLIVQFESSTRLIGMSLYDYYAKQYSDPHLHLRAFMWNVNMHDVSHLYDMIDDELLTADCKPTSVADPGSPDIELLKDEFKNAKSLEEVLFLTDLEDGRRSSSGIRRQSSSASSL